jgi:hypothetical protein
VVRPVSFCCPLLPKSNNSFALTVWKFRPTVKSCILSTHCTHLDQTQPKIHKKKRHLEGSPQNASFLIIFVLYFLRTYRFLRRCYVFSTFYRALSYDTLSRFILISSATDQRSAFPRALPPLLQHIEIEDWPHRWVKPLCVSRPQNAPLPSPTPSRGFFESPGSTGAPTKPTEQQQPQISQLQLGPLPPILDSSASPPRVHLGNCTSSCPVIRKTILGQFDRAFPSNITIASLILHHTRAHSLHSHDIHYHPTCAFGDRHLPCCTRHLISSFIPRQGLPSSLFFFDSRNTR